MRGLPNSVMSAPAEKARSLPASTTAAHAAIVPGFRERLHHALAQRMAERVDWRVSQRDQRDVAVPPVIYGLVDAAHRAPPPFLRRNAA